MALMRKIKIAGLDEGILGSVGMGRVFVKLRAGWERLREKGGDVLMMVAKGAREIADVNERGERG